MQERALITGAAGFAGRYLRNHLGARGWDIVAIDHLPAEGVLPCDITDETQVKAFFDTIAPVSHLFHLAALTFVPEAQQHPAKAMRVNLEGTVNIADTLRRHSHEARLVYISSAEVYGPPQRLPIDENHPLHPAIPYAISKAAADQYCAYLAHGLGMDVIRLRPFNHSGPGQADCFVLPAFARQIAEIEAGLRPPRIEVGNLDAARDFSHVRDVVRAYEEAALNGESGQVYNICAAKAIRIGDALDKLLALSSCKIEVIVDPARLRPVDIPEIYGSSQKLAAQTGWQPEIPFDTLLEELLDDWRARVRA